MIPVCYDDMADMVDFVELVVKGVIIPIPDSQLGIQVTYQLAEVGIGGIGAFEC